MCNLIDNHYQLVLLLMISVAAASCNDPCDEVNCLNGGACVDGDCICEEGWTGDDCSIETWISPDCEPVEYYGYTYQVVAIGTQCWFKENLRTDKYRNGEAIPGNFNDDAWHYLKGGAQSVYGENSVPGGSGSGNVAANLANYGRLYNWWATIDHRRLCPTGWHVPTIGEWTALIDFLGGSSAGPAMKASPSDSLGWNGSNTSGFSGVPGGARAFFGGYFEVGHEGHFWSSTRAGNYAHRCKLNSSDIVWNISASPRSGMSVRCIRN